LLILRPAIIISAYEQP